MFGWDSHCLSAAISLWVMDSILQQQHQFIYAWAKSFHSESHTWPRAKNTEAKTETPIWKWLFKLNLELFFLLFIIYFWTNCIYAAFELLFGFCPPYSGLFAILCTPAADDFNGVLLATLLVPALPADGETALAQRRPLKTQLVMQEKLGLLRERTTWRNKNNLNSYEQNKNYPATPELLAPSRKITRHVPHP